jgi:hypothetical protein
MALARKGELFLQGSIFRISKRIKALPAPISRCDLSVREVESE